jgi:SAM-dependent methyltransferase
MRNGFGRLLHYLKPLSVLRKPDVPSTLGLSRHRFHSEDGEKNSEWYDASFENNPEWKLHYSKSEYYFLWAVIVDRMSRAGGKSVFEIGCGAGQLACLIRDHGVCQYTGFDFSAKRIARAREVCAEFRFSQEDAFTTNLFESTEYDSVVCTEFLEHVEDDIGVIRRIRSGSTFYGTVPNFPYTSHVRYFSSAEEVESRYRHLFSDMRVDTFVADDRGKTFFLIEGTRA